MSLLFDEKETFEKHTEPYKPAITTDTVLKMNFSKKFQAELYNDHQVLYDLQSILFTMIMTCRAREQQGIMTSISEEDLYLLYKIARKDIQLKKKSK